MITPARAQTAAPMGSTSQKLMWMPASRPGGADPKMLTLHWLKNDDMSHAAT